MTGLLMVPATTPAQAAETKAAAAQVIDVDDLPDPLDRGTYTPKTIQEVKLGTAALQEPDSSGAAPAAAGVSSPADLEIRGALYYPDFSQRTEPSPLIVLVHGNHGSCDAGSDTATATCTAYKRNEAGYAYLGENLASWGYTVFSLSQDQLMLRQDNNKGKGMHQRRLLIAAALDALSAASKAGGLPTDAHTTIGTTLAGNLDMTRIGLMGHSRGGDAVTNFIDYNRTRTDGPRYPLRGVISLAQTDYERKAPYGVPFMSILPFCDGDVSNLQGARTFERSQYVNGNDPFPRVQSSQLGAIHNWYNTVWYADAGADGQGNNDAACGNSAPFVTNNVHPNNLRLSGAADPSVPAKNYVVDNSDTYNPLVNTKISGDPSRMGDQEKIGLATMSAFFRRYVGGEGAFDAYLTGELSDTSSHLQIPTSACPTSVSGTRIGCEEYVSTNYFPPASERVDVIRPEIVNPLTVNALGGALSGEGFANPYIADGGVTPKPETTTNGYDWCNPEPDDFAPAQLGKTTLPTAAKACPLPGVRALGGQSNGMRENAPVNHSYGGQLALAWETGRTAKLAADIPAISSDVSNLKALSMSADVNFFDLRNPGADNRGDNTRVVPTTPAGALPTWPNEKPTSYDPTSTTQDFLIALKDTKGNEATVHAGDERWGNALHMSTGTNTPNTHVVLDQIRVPLSEFAKQGVDITSLDAVELRFGEAGTPQSGSIQLSDVRFQEAATDKPLILSDGTGINQGAGHGKPTTGPDPADFLAETDVTPGSMKLVDTVANQASNTTWVVDDDGVQCPAASFTSIQKAVDFASPWDTIVVCDGTYEESSKPINGSGNPVASGSLNGLTITKPLKIKGAGADKVTIMPDQKNATLAGSTPYLRDGGGNVITASRQSLGSTDTSEMFVDISGVTVTAGNTFAEAGIAFFGTAGRVSESVVGPMKVAKDAAELAANPHGWGIVKTGVVRGAGEGTVENEVTVANSVVTGYQSGGVLFDGGRGADGAAANTVRSGLKEHGYVARTVVEGSGSDLFPQTGIKYASGTDGFVNGSRITGNYFASDPTKSFGLLLTDAKTETPGALTAQGNVITGNGFAVYNADAGNTAVREGGPFTISRSYLGQGAPVAGGPASPSTGREAVSGASTTGQATVSVTARASSTIASVPTGAGAVTDKAPSAALIDLGSKTVTVGQTVAPLVRAKDDFAVKSATLLANGWPVATTSTAPYTFSWTATPGFAGQDVVFATIVTDSAGNTTRSASATVSVEKGAGTPPANPTPPTGVFTPTLKIKEIVKKPSKGRSTIYATVNTAGKVSVTGSKIATDSVRTRRASTVKITLKPNKAQRKILNRRGSVTVTFKLSFKAESGGTATQTRTVVIKKR